METNCFKGRNRNTHSVWGKIGLAALASFWASNGVPPAQSDVATVSQMLNADLSAAGKVSVPASLSLTPAGGVFSPYAGSMTLRYLVRTTPGGSGGNVTVQATGDFNPAGGPTVSSAGLAVSCSGATLGTPCAGQNPVGLASSTNLVAIPPSACTGGGGACSEGSPNTVSLDFSMANDPSYETGSYTAVVTFTISAL